VIRGAAMALVALLLAGTGCGNDGGQEGAGDRAYGEARYEEALAAYAPLAEAAPSARLWAKVGAAALHLGKLREATAAYEGLAEADPTRADEAAEGLERVIRFAERRVDPVALAEAVEALRKVAPGRALGRHATSLVQDARGPVAASDLAAALAAATEPAAVDSLLLRQAAALAQAGNCAAALPLYRAALRRAGRAGNPAAEAALVDCAYRLGTSMLAAAPDSAEAWFRDAASADSTSGVGRAAMIGVGDARARQGDLVGAALAYQAALAGGVADDSLARVASSRLNGLASASGPDTFPPVEP